MVMFKDYEMIHMASGLTILTVYSLGVVNFDTYSSHTSIMREGMDNGIDVLESETFPLFSQKEGL
jgi:hypothetical protein